MQKIASLVKRQYKIPTLCEATYEQHSNFDSGIYWQTAKRNKLKDKMNSTQREILLRLTGTFSTISAEALCIVIWIMPLHFEIARMPPTGINSTNHIERRANETTPRDIIHFLTEHGPHYECAGSISRTRRYVLFRLGRLTEPGTDRESRNLEARQRRERVSIQRDRKKSKTEIDTKVCGRKANFFK